MNAKKNFYKVLIALSSTFLLIIYIFMFFTYKNSIISSAILRSNIISETLSSNSTHSLSTIEILDNLDVSTVNEFDITSSTDYLLLASTTDQKIYAFKGSINNWILKKEFACSTGLLDSQTPKCIFTCKFINKTLFSQKLHKNNNYCFCINNYNAFHIPPFYESTNAIDKEILDDTDYHCCIRLSIVDSKWIYDNIQYGSTLIIY